MFNFNATAKIQPSLMAVNAPKDGAKLVFNFAGVAVSRPAISDWRL